MHDAYVSQADPPPMAQYMIEDGDDGDDDEDDDDDYDDDELRHDDDQFDDNDCNNELTIILFCSGLINEQFYVEDKFKLAAAAKQRLLVKDPATDLGETKGSAMPQPPLPCT